MTIRFSPQPGPRERQLQRKLNNPLFVAASRLTQQQVDTAQQQDQLALQQFLQEFRDTVQRAVALDKNVESDVILLLKAQLEQQYAVCCGLPGRPLDILDALKKLIAAIGSTLRSTSQSDPHALEKLEQDEAHTRLYLQLCEHLIVSDILNPDEIIGSEEQIPSLLNESGQGLQAALLLFDPERIALMVEEAQHLLRKVEAEGHSLPAAWQRLAQMERWLQGEEQ
jgi:hypothetical protein